MRYQGEIMTKNWTARVDAEAMNTMAAIISRGPIHYTELTRIVGKSVSWVRYGIAKMIEAGREEELSNLRAWRRGSRIEVNYVENIRNNREMEAEKLRTKERVMAEIIGCRWCGMLGQLAGNQNGRKRTVCDSCLVDHDMRQNNPDHTRTWRHDPRWTAIIAKRHQATGGCVICGSSRAAMRDGRYCDWRHDPVMLDFGELDALLDRYSTAPSRFDVWGNLL
jgi:hypothetical protein